MAAIFLHQVTGYLALVGKYEFPRHHHRDRVVHQVLSLDVIAALRDRSGDANVQAPDLLMYAPDHSDWFCCEVKGPGDRLNQTQHARFAALAALTRKPVRMLKFRWAPGGARTRAAPTGLTVAAMRKKERAGG